MNDSNRWTLMSAASALMVGMLLITACGDTDEAESRPPVVELRIDAETPVVVGREIRLDASGSTDPDEDPLSFAWGIVARPDASGAALADRNSAVARFTPDATGDHTVEVTVGDGTHEATARRTLEVVPEDNGAPIADAGADATASVGSEVVLDGSGSSDPDRDALTFAWQFAAKPGDSAATLQAADSPIATFTVDTPGTYELTLTVSDSDHDVQDSVTVRGNAAPQAAVGADREAAIGMAVELDGSASSDPDGDTLMFQWSLISAPAESTAAIADADTQKASLPPDKTGIYVVELMVSDGKADDTARLTIEAIAEGSTGSSILHLAPDGDDTNPGTPEAPMATLGAALQKAAGNETVRRLELAAGTYDQGATSHTVSRDLEIVGAEGGEKPVIAGSDNLLAVEGTAFVALLRLELRSDETAVHVGDEAAVSVTEVECRASRCMTTGKFLTNRGGRVTVKDSTLTGTGTPLQGILAIQADDVTVANTVIEGFTANAGIKILESSATIRNSVFRDNEIGIDLLANQSEHAVIIRDSQFTGNAIGVKASNAKNVSIRDTTIETSSETGILARGGALRLENVTVESGGGDGLVIEQLAAASAGVIIVRQSTITGHVGDGVVVQGPGSTLDLGNDTTPGNNDLRFNKGAGVRDARPDGASGIVTLRDTRLAFQTLAPGEYAGPNFSQWGLRIENENTVRVY